MAPSSSPSYRGKHAIVIGGSIAGFVATRVLSNHFERVTLIERDPFSDSPTPRKGVPQGHHVHAILSRGYTGLLRFFPTLGDDLRNGGAVMDIDTGQYMLSYIFGGYMKPFVGGAPGVAVSRGLLDWALVRAVRLIPNVTIMDGTVVSSLIPRADGTGITGVNIKPHDGDSEPTALTADLVVDTTGRGSHTPKWLEQLGYNAPKETTVNINLGYVSRLYTRSIPNDATPPIYSVMSMPPENKRMGAIFPIEGQRWLVTMAGALGDYPSTDEETWLAFAHTLPTSDITRLIANETPVSDIRQYRFAANFRRHYEQLQQFPEGLMVMGDAISSFNPLYGQGITISVLEAENLDQLLSEVSDLQGFGKKFFKRIAKMVDEAWQMATGGDFRYPEVQGERPASTKFVHMYQEWVMRATHNDAEVHRAINSVMHMTAPATALFKPSILARVLKQRFAPGAA